MRQIRPCRRNPRHFKTRLKEAMQELQMLGGELVELSRDQLKRINLPEELHKAILEWQRFGKHEARRRQLQYIGKLMRNIDPEPIHAGLASLRGESAVEIARMHRLEKAAREPTRRRKTLTEIVAARPQADLTHLRQLRRSALKEKEKPANRRKISAPSSNC